MFLLHKNSFLTGKGVKLFNRVCGRRENVQTIRKSHLMNGRQARKHIRDSVFYLIPLKKIYILFTLVYLPD